MVIEGPKFILTLNYNYCIYFVLMMVSYAVLIMIALAILVLLSNIIKDIYHSDFEHAKSIVMDCLRYPFRRQEEPFNDL